LKRYDAKEKVWIDVVDNLIDGEGKRNAYWQLAIDTKGLLHLSWVWRESADVASNHDVCYARSADAGKTWQKSDGGRYSLPITASTAEYAAIIPQKSELINHTSMCADEDGNPYIASYWRNAHDSIPQYRIIYRAKGEWLTLNPGFRKMPFSLNGVGTKSIPISRPQVIAWKHGKKQAVALIFRDEERGSKISIASNDDLNKQNWIVKDLTESSVGSWEPTYDTELCQQKKILNLFVQKTTQIDGEGNAALPSQPVQVLQWAPNFN
jgi:hypothetical protein